MQESKEVQDIISAANLVVGRYELNMDDQLPDAIEKLAQALKARTRVRVEKTLNKGA